MKAVMLYRPNSEDARKVETYVHDFKQLHGKDIEVQSLDTREGSDMARLYDLMSHPSLIIIRDDGQLVKSWSNATFPLLNELASYMEL